MSYKPNRIEELNKEFTNNYFLRSYHFLHKLPKVTPAMVRLIELVLSFQLDNKPFNQHYEVIGVNISVEEESLRAMVSRLKKMGIILTNYKSNYNPQTGQGGAKSKLWVNIDRIEELLKKPEPIVIEDNTPIIPEIEKPRENNNNLFGEPNTIEYLYGGKWWIMDQHINEEITTLQNYNKSLTIDMIKDACEGKNVDTGLFQFRLTKQQEHETNI